MTRNTSKGGSRSITLSADKDFDNGWDTFISYTNLTVTLLYDSTSSQMNSSYRGESRASALFPSNGTNKMVSRAQTYSWC